MKKIAFIGALVIGTSALAYLYFWKEVTPADLQMSLSRLSKSLLTEEEPVERYGIDLEDLYVCTDVIKPNENFGEILSKNGIPMEVINDVVAKSQGVLDLRKITAGKSYCIMRDVEHDGAQYFVYEQDAVNYVIYSLGENVEVKRGSKQVITETRGASGVISSSLWNTFEENDLNLELAMQMANIYAWTIDFFHLQKGDHFKVLYDEQFVDGNSVGISEIKGAIFNHKGEDFHAIFYDQDSSAGYYDANAKSLRRAFLKAPLEFRRISSHFNKRRFHPVLKRSRPHLGTDYAAATGTPIWTIGDGEVLRAEFNRGNGNFVEIKHNGTYTTKYLHMSKFGEGIKKGAHVKQGQVIGYVGSTGLATGPHLHFELIKDGAHVDAIQESIPSGAPIAPECIDAFNQYRDQVLSLLNKIKDPVQRFADASANGKRAAL